MTADFMLARILDALHDWYMAQEAREAKEVLADIRRFVFSVPVPENPRKIELTGQDFPEI